MQIELSGLVVSMLILAVGLGFMGYFIGDGLKNMGKPDSEHPATNFIKKEDLPIYFSLDKEEIDDLLDKHPNAPKIILNGTTYYPYKQFLYWLSSAEIYKSSNGHQMDNG